MQQTPCRWKAGNPINQQEMDMPYTSPRLNALATVARWMFGHIPTHAEKVWLHGRLFGRIA